MLLNDELFLIPPDPDFLMLGEEVSDIALLKGEENVTREGEGWEKGL